MKKSKFVAVLTAAALAIMLVACDNGSNTTDDDTPAGTVVDPTSEKPKTDEEPAAEEEETPAAESKYAACFDTPYHFLESIITEIEVEKSASSSVKASKFSKYSREADDIRPLVDAAYVKTSAYEGAYQTGTEAVATIKYILLNVKNIEFDKRIPTPDALKESNMKLTDETCHLIIEKESDTKASLYWTFSTTNGDGEKIWQAHKITNYVNDAGDFCTSIDMYIGDYNILYATLFTRNENLVTYSQVMDKDYNSFNYTSKDKAGIFKTVNNLSTNLIGCIKESDGGVLLSNQNGDKNYYAFNSDNEFIYQYHITMDNEHTNRFYPLYALKYETKPAQNINENYSDNDYLATRNGDTVTITGLNVYDSNP
ncbi:MAG: hypothetical protein K5786_00470, partial [Treponema sp.]|nr:hypothetical protein [Treponema sp.]